MYISIYNIIYIHINMYHLPALLTNEQFVWPSLSQLNKVPAIFSHTDQWP